MSEEIHLNFNVIAFAWMPVKIWELSPSPYNNEFSNLLFKFICTCICVITITKFYK